MNTISQIAVDNTCRAAVMTFGKESQIDMAIEECGELIVALQHYKRGRKTDVETEIADVEIMMNQLRCIFNSFKVDAQIEFKILRLQERLNDA